MFRQSAKQPMSLESETALQGGTVCPFCRATVERFDGSYAECHECDVLISHVPAAPYDESYYYAQLNARTRKSIRRAELLWGYFRHYIAGRDCLDFGCNDGAFVAQARRNGVNCEGTDVNDQALALAKAEGDGIFRRPQELAGRHFGCVTAFDVIEHFDSLEEFFSLVSTRLASGGRLLITTPNKNSKWYGIFGLSWHGLGIPQYHRFVLSQQLLRRQLHAHGFEVEALFTTPPVEARGWKLLVASGYRLRKNKLVKACTLPMAIVKFVTGKTLISGEDDTLCVVARRTDTQNA